MNYTGEQNVPGAGGNLGGMLAGNPFGQQFVIPQRGIRGMTPSQLEELKQWDPGSSQELQNIYNNIKPGGPSLLPLAYSNGSTPMGNVGAMDEFLGNRSGMEGAQLAGGFNLLNPMSWFGQAQEAVENSKKGIRQGSNKTPINTILNSRAAEAEALRREGL